MIKITPKQQVLLDDLQRLGKASVITLSKSTNTELKATFAHLRRLHNLKLIHICEWSKGSSGHPLKVFKYGAGEDAQVDRKDHYDKVKQDNAAKRFTKRNTYDPDAPLVPNNGWVSTIHSWDRTVSQSEHIEFMKRFQPHPDRASAWLFNEPKVELLGAKYENNCMV
jgi:hypothetical protein